MAKRPVREDQHGTLTGYGYGCRCDRCREAKRIWERGYLERNPEQRAKRVARTRISNKARYDRDPEWRKALLEKNTRYNNAHPVETYLASLRWYRRTVQGLTHLEKGQE